MTNRLGSIITPWTDIILAQQGDPVLRAKCLEELAEKYYDAVRAYIGAKSRVKQPCDLDDMTQDFFQRFLERELLNVLDREKGTLRGFLMKTLDWFVLDEKRGAARHNAANPLTRSKSLQYAESVVDDNAPSPEDQFNRLWADELMHDIIVAFKMECQDHGKPHYYAVAERHILYPKEFGNPQYSETAAKLGISEKDVANYLHRAKKNLQNLTWRKVRETVETDEEVDAEIILLRKYYSL